MVWRHHTPCATQRAVKSTPRQRRSAKSGRDVVGRRRICPTCPSSSLLIPAPFGSNRRPQDKCQRILICVRNSYAAVCSPAMEAIDARHFTLRLNCKIVLAKSTGNRRHRRSVSEAPALETTHSFDKELQNEVFSNCPRFGLRWCIGPDIHVRCPSGTGGKAGFQVREMLRGRQGWQERLSDDAIVLRGYLEKGPAGGRVDLSASRHLRQDPRRQH